MNTSRIAGWVLIAIGTISLALSILYYSQIPAFIGLGLLFWGIILTYVHTESGIRSDILTATTIQPLETLTQITQQLEYKGDMVYLPPKYLKDPDEIKAYIPKQKGGSIPTPEEAQQQKNIFLESPSGLLITPPGAELARLFEKTLGTTFTKVDLQYVEQNLPKLLIEDLEIAQEVETQTEKDKVLIRIKTTNYSDLVKTLREIPEVNASLSDPLTSALASALAKATGKLITIKKQQTSTDGTDIETEYGITD